MIFKEHIIYRLLSGGADFEVVANKIGSAHISLETTFLGAKSYAILTRAETEALVEALNEELERGI